MQLEILLWGDSEICRDILSASREGLLCVHLEKDSFVPHPCRISAGGDGAEGILHEGTIIMEDNPQSAWLPQSLAVFKGLAKAQWFGQTF